MGSLVCRSHLRYSTNQCCQFNVILVIDVAELLTEICFDSEKGKNMSKNVFLYF